MEKTQEKAKSWLIEEKQYTERSFEFNPMLSLNTTMLYMAEFSGQQPNSQKETIKKLREVSEELLQWNNKCPPGKIYGYGLAKVMEVELQKIVSKAEQVLYDLDNTTEPIDNGE